MMRTTGPMLRRRNARWPRHQRRQLRTLHEDEDHADSGSEADDEGDDTPRFFKPALQPNAVVSVGSGTGGVATPAPTLESSTGLVPGVTLGAEEDGLDVEGDEEEEEEEEEEDEEEEDGEGEDEGFSDESSSDSDDVTDGEASSSDESDAETTLPPPGPPGTSATRPAIAPPAGVQTIPLPTATTSRSAGASPVLAPIGGIVGEPTATTSSSQSGIMSQVQPTMSTSTRAEPNQTTSSPSATVPTSETITASPPPPADLPNPPAAGISNGPIGEVDRLVTGSAPESTSLAESSPVLSEGGAGMETGAAAGIIIGVLAFVGILLIAGWFIFKKMRSRESDSDPDPESSSGGLPAFFNKFRSSENRSTYAWKFWDSNSSAGTRTTVGVPPPVSTAQLPMGKQKTNSEIVDDLMRAAYEAESGGKYNDMESRVGYLDEKAPVPAQVNEQTYKALFGNGPNSPMPPRNAQGAPPANGGNGMTKWLDGTVTPRESRFGPPASNVGVQAQQDWPPMPQQAQYR
ncbi:hypothetical protein V8F20_010384 [Naviculisporaceae sp. PSN 640]